MIRISRSYPVMAEADSITVGAAVPSTVLSGLVNPQLHQFAMLNLHNVPCETSYQDPEVITSAPSVGEPSVELIWRGHPRLTHVMVMMRVQVADVSGAPASLKAELYSAPTAASGTAFVWTGVDGGVVWQESSGTLTPTPGNFGVWLSRVITTGSVVRVPTAPPDPPRPLVVGTRDDYYKVRLIPSYVRIHQATVIELFNAEVAA